MLRAGRLVPAVYRRIGIPRAVLSTSRSGVMAARMLGSKCFTILDYEGVETLVYRTFGTTVLHPEVIPASEFSALGFPEHRLVSFPGLKEDISFSGMNLTKVRPAELPSPRDPRLPAILVRPPSETSHYRVNASSDALGRILDHLADRSDAQVVFAPRESKQEQMLSARQWSVPPVLLRQPIPLVDLLRSVDRVLTGGGTMLREAAWFGVPTVTVFQGALPYVDRWLESEGRIERIGPSDDPAKFQWQAELERRAEGSVNGASLETVVKALES